MTPEQRGYIASQANPYLNDAHKQGMTSPFAAPPPQPPAGSVGADLASQFQELLDAGWAGNKFLKRHPRFAENYGTAMQGADQTPDWRTDQAAAGGNQGGNTDGGGNAGGGQGQGQGPDQGQGKPGGGGGGGNGPGNAIEMNPHYQQGLAQLDDALRAELASIGVERNDMEAMLGLVKSRLGFEHQEGLRRVDEGANERGIFNSGIRMRDRGYTDVDFNRRYQDLDLQRLEGTRGLAQREARAHEDRRRGGNDLALRIAEFLAQTLPLDVPGTAPEPGGGGGGGGGSTTPKNQPKTEKKSAGKKSANKRGNRRKRNVRGKGR